jgi:hypothetical protein
MAWSETCGLWRPGEIIDGHKLAIDVDRFYKMAIWRPSVTDSAVRGFAKLNKFVSVKIG